MQLGCFRAARLLAALFGPGFRINREGHSASRLRIEQGSMMVDLPIPEQTRQHGKGARYEDVIDERFLPVECLRRGAARQVTFATSHLNNGWEDL